MATTDLTFEQKAIKALFSAIVALLSVMILALFVPTMISILITISTESTFTDCFTSVLYWIFTAIGLVVSSIYISEETKKD